MKKSILLIAPLTLLVACTGSSEIFDDAYHATEAPKVSQTDEEEGYADYIKEQEDQYPVKVEDTPQNRSMTGVNPSYYGNNDQEHNHDHAMSGNNGQFYNGYNNFYQPNNTRPGFVGNNFWGVCQFSCNSWFRNGNCWHLSSDPYAGLRPGPGYGWGYSGFYPMGYNYNDNYFGGAYYYGYYNPNNIGGWGSTFGNSGWCGNNFYGNGFYNNYYGNGFYNNYYGYGGWGSPYGYGYGWDPYWGYGGLYPGWGMNSWGNNNNGWNWGDNNGSGTTTSGGNHYVGHRGGTNTGSYSQNNTNYEHTVKMQTANTPFPLYEAKEGTMVQADGSGTAQPNGSFNAVKHNEIEAVHNPVENNNGNGIVKPHTVSFNQPNKVSKNTFHGQNNTSNLEAKPANNNVSRPVQANTNSVVSKGKPATNQFSKIDNSSRNTYSGNTTYTATSNGSTSAKKYNAHPNKYGQSHQNNGSNQTYTRPPSTYSGNTNSSSRRTYNSGTRSTNTNMNSGNRSTTISTNRSSGSSFNGNRSSGSSSSGSRSGSSSSGGSSRRR